MDNLLARIPAAVIATDSRGLITYWNRHAEALYGWSAEDALGRSAVELLVRPEDVDTRFAFMRQFLVGHTWEGELSVRRKDGAEVVVWLRNGPLRDEADSVVGFVGVSVQRTGDRPPSPATPLSPAGTDPAAVSSRPGEEHVAAPGSRSRAERTAPVERADADRPGRAGAPRSGLAARASANRHALALRASASRHALAVRASANRHTLTALAIVTALAVTDALLGSAAMFTGLLVIGPFTASAFVGPGRTALVGVYAAAAAVALGVPDEFFGTTEHVVRCAGVAVGGGLATWVSWRREQRDELLERVARVAEVAQRAILRPLPPVVGAVAFAHRYLSASREARVGGDLYEVVDTVHGVRAVVGDVRGKGLEAVRLASVVLGSFREAAYTQPCLRTVAAAMNVSVARHLRAEDFVTVVLAEFHEGRLRLVNCGHHPPLAWRADKGMEFLVPETTCPPLGLDPEPNVTSFELAAGDRVLFYTDGLVEARDAGGAFLALEDAAHACGDHPSLDEAVDRLVSELLLHVNGQLHDDLALVLAEQLVPDPPAVGAPA